MVLTTVRVGSRWTHLPPSEIGFSVEPKFVVYVTVGSGAVIVTVLVSAGPAVFLPITRKAPASVPPCRALPS